LIQDEGNFVEVHPVMLPHDVAIEGNRTLAGKKEVRKDVCSIERRRG